VTIVARKESPSIPWGETQGGAGDIVNEENENSWGEKKQRPPQTQGAWESGKSQGSKWKENNKQKMSEKRGVNDGKNPNRNT